MRIINECSSGNTAREELNRVITTCPLSPICVKMIWKQHKNIKEVVQVQVGVSRQNIRRKMKCWIKKQHLILWRGPCSTQRQARGLISGPDLATRAQLLSFHRTQPRIEIGLPTGHNTLRKHLYIMGPSNCPICRKCGTEEETSVHILCECEALASLRRTHLGSFFLEPEDIRKLNIGTIWNFAKRTGLL
jgi:hypothetical protein